MSLSDSLTSLADWLRWLETLSPTEIELGLDRVAEVICRLELDRSMRVLHVGGTNGKGSSVAMLESLYRESGFRTGSYTSPHLQAFNERIAVNGVSCSDQQIIAAFRRVESVRSGVALTYFEYGTLAALVVFDALNAEVVILEVGLGGRLDAVNAVEPDGSLITNVSLDHCDWLGDDIESIAREKAGIMRAQQPVVFGSGEVPAAIEEVASGLGADLRLVGRDFNWEYTGEGFWSWAGRSHSFDRLPRPSLPGRVQIENAAAVIAMVEALDEHILQSEGVVAAALTNLTLPGRMQQISGARNWVLDVAHNPAAAATLAEEISRQAGDIGIVAVIGMLDDKDIVGVINSLSSVVNRWIAVSLEAQRAVPAYDLAARIATVTGKPCLISPKPGDALDAARRQTREGDMILVAGSFYVVGPALDELYSRRTAGPEG